MIRECKRLHKPGRTGIQLDIHKRHANRPTFDVSAGLLLAILLCITTGPLANGIIGIGLPILTVPALATFTNVEEGGGADDPAQCRDKPLVGRNAQIEGPYCGTPAVFSISAGWWCAGDLAFIHCARLSLRNVRNGSEKR